MTTPTSRAAALLVTASPRGRWVASRWFAIDSEGVVKSYAEPIGEPPADCTLESLEAQRGR